MLRPVDKQPDFPKLERAILERWKERDILHRSIERDAPKGNYVFYEGPPTANGKPGIHHVISRAFKDLFLRYKTMRGYRVRRRHGWDTHGLPVEVQIEKQIGAKDKRDVEAFGVEKFNKLCRDSVFTFIGDWNELTERIAFWLDLEDGYVTYTNGYIETCWWILKEFFDRGLLFEDYKTTMHCPRCNTSLASHEVSLGMTEGVDDPSVWPVFRLTDDSLGASALAHEAAGRPVHLMAWTTTPWTLPANTGLAVKLDASYALVEAPVRHADPGGPKQLYVLAEALVERTFEDRPHKTLVTCTGRDLTDLHYEPLFSGHIPEDEELSGGWRIVADDFVSLDDGTGIVHIAPAYGDMEVGKTHGLPTVFSVDLVGEIYSDVKARFAGGRDHSGVFFKDADPGITEDLENAGLLYRHGRIEHTYPLCWRDDTPLLYYAKHSWYIRTTAVKDLLVRNNLETVNWVPEHIKHGRFGKWLEGNVDWAISRERFWGTPLPIWESEDGDKICVGSVAQLSELAGRDLTDLDLHRPAVDDITITADGKEYRRVPYTIDVWFDSGAMPYAQWHFPFENEDVFHENFPADYICEGIDQTRGWFYSLHAIATLLTDPGDEATGRPPGALANRHEPSSAYKNCLVVGLINDAEGRKMSKSRGNAVDPWQVLDTQGADVLRWYMFTAAPAEQNLNFNPDHLLEMQRSFFQTLWNSYGFFVTYARIDEPDLARPIPMSERSDFDRWLAARLHALIIEVTEALDRYDGTGAGRAIAEFVKNDLSNWYLRLNRRRFWKSSDDADKNAAFRTVYEALDTVARLAAPMAPFISEEIYRNLVLGSDPEAPESVHLAAWPEADASLVDEELLHRMEAARTIIELGRRARTEAQIGVRQPLSEMQVRVGSEAQREAVRSMEDMILAELNIRSLELLPFDTELVSYQVKPNYRLVGRRLAQRMPLFAKAVAALDAAAVAHAVQAGEHVTVELDGEPESFEPEAFLIDVKGPEGRATVEEGATLVSINTELSEELLAEGKARDLVRLIQNARKEADLDVADRIVLGLELEGDLRNAARIHRDYLCGEVLAAELHFGPIDDPQHEESADLKGDAVRIMLRRLEQ